MRGNGYRTSRLALVVLILMSTVVATGVAFSRMKVESLYNDVELVVDYTESLQAAMMAGIPEDEYLIELKRAGAVSMAVEEDTFGALEARGDVMALSEAELKKMAMMSSAADQQVSNLISDDESSVSGGTYVICLEESVRPRLEEVMPIRLKLISGSYMTSYRGKMAIYIPLDLKAVMALNIGLDPDTVDPLNSMGFDVVARLSNGVGITASWIDYMFSFIGDRDFIKTVVFKGDEVLGYPDKLDYVADKMSGGNGLFYGSVEFAAQRGLDELLRKGDSKMVRVHSVTREELDKGMDFRTVSDRYCRAVRERNIRMLYMRPLSLKSVGVDEANSNVQLISDVSSRLLNEGFSVGNVNKLGQISVGRTSLSLLVLGTAAAFMLILGAFVRLPSVIALGVPVISAMCFYLGITVRPGLLNVGIKFASLVAALVFPVLSGMVLLARGFKFSTSGGEGKSLSVLIEASCRFVLSCAISVAGGLVLAAFLTRNSFMLKLDQFSGVKLMHIFPLLAVVLIYWLWYVKREDESLVSSVVKLANSPVLFWHAGLVAVIGVAGIIYIARTGNSSIIPVGVSGVEEAFRTFLERTMVIRPRTKELLLGHPAFMLAGTIMARNEKFLLFPISIVAMIGQVSMVNTFAHMHTPISVTLTRTFLGIGIGYLIGLLLLCLYNFFANRASSRER